MTKLLNIKPHRLAAVILLALCVGVGGASLTRNGSTILKDRARSAVARLNSHINGGRTSPELSPQKHARSTPEIYSLGLGMPWSGENVGLHSAPETDVLPTAFFSHPGLPPSPSSATASRTKSWRDSGMGASGSRSTAGGPQKAFGGNPMNEFPRYESRPGRASAENQSPANVADDTATLQLLTITLFATLLSWRNALSPASRPIRSGR